MHQMTDPGEETVTVLVSRLVDDAKELARAEVDLVKVQAVARLGGYRASAILFGTAGLLTIVALIGLVVGLILTLAPRIGPGWATLVVIGTIVVLAGLLGWLGLQRWKQG